MAYRMFTELTALGCLLCYCARVLCVCRPVKESLEEAVLGAEGEQDGWGRGGSTRANPACGRMLLGPGQTTPLARVEAAPGTHF
jgi:hypothetical protein